MEDENRRKPIANFIIEKDIQIPFIKKMLFIVGISTLITILIVFGIYFLYAQKGYLYLMSSDIDKPLAKKSFIEIALPGFLISEIFTLLLGFVIALIGSRKSAVPVYKIKRWANAIAHNNFNVNLVFREKGEYENLTKLCNYASQSVRKVLKDIDMAVNNDKLKHSYSDIEKDEAIRTVKNILKKYKY